MLPQATKANMCVLTVAVPVLLTTPPLLYCPLKCFYECLKEDIKAQCCLHNDTIPIMPYCGGERFPI